MYNKVLFSLIIVFCFSIKLAALEVSDTVCSETECYTVIKELGEGAFGKVFAVENAQGCRYALKSYKGEEDAYYSDMDREFLRGQFFDHPNIIKSYECFSWDGERYLVLQFVKGEVLWSKLQGSLSSEEGKKAARHFAEALGHAHTMGFLHLDLHSGNLMIDENADIMVIDLASFFSYDEVLQGLESYGTYKNSPLSPRMDKIHKFFAGNPLLLKKLQSTLKVKGTESQALAKAELDAYYFDNVTDMTRTILHKAKLSREEKVEFSSKIKTLSWIFTYDVEEGQYPMLEEQFIELVNLF